MLILFVLEVMRMIQGEVHFAECKRLDHDRLVSANGPFLRRH